MKYLMLLVTVTLAGCATKTTRVTEYCDNNWQGRWNTWQQCYHDKMGEPSVLAAGLGGFSKGFNQSRQNQQPNQSSTTCITTGNSGLYTTNCN